TGLAFALDTCRLITSAEEVDDAIIDLGFDDGFRGIHAESAQVHWDIPLALNGRELPGLYLDLDDVAIGNKGVSTTATLSWPVTHDGHAFDLDQTDLYGELFGWACAIDTAEVVIERNVPIGTAVNAYLAAVPLQQIFRIELGFRVGEGDQYDFHLNLAQASDDPVVVPLGRDDFHLAFSNLSLAGEFDSEGDFSLVGSAAIDLDLPGLSFSSEAISIAYDHESGLDSLRIDLTDLELEGYGDLDSAQLILVLGEGEDGESALLLFELIADLSWAKVSERIALADAPPLLPLPPDDGEVALRAYWIEDQLKLSIRAALDDVDALWPFVPAGLRPAVPEAAIDIALEVVDDDFEGELGIELTLLLPDLAAAPALQAVGLGEVVDLSTGDATGLVQLRFSAALDSSDEHGATTGSLSATVTDLVTVGLQLPGMTFDEPPVQLALEEVAIELDADGESVTGVIRLEGSFLLQPILPAAATAAVPPPMAVQLDRLLAIAREVDLTGSASLTLGISEDNAWFEAQCTFDDASLEVDLFDMLANLSGTNKLLGEAGGENEIDLDIDVAIALEQIRLSIGSADAAQGDDGNFPFAFGITTGLAFAGQNVDLEFELTDEHLSFGLDLLRIPIAIPKLPLSREDLDQLRDGSGQWDYQGRWVGDIEPDLDALITEREGQLADVLAILDDTPLSEEWERFELEFRALPAIQKALVDALGRKFLYQAVLAVHQMLGAVGVEGSQQTYQGFVERYQDAVDAVFGSLHADTNLVFEIRDVEFLLPFNDPADIRVAGGAAITGFAPDDPLAPLGDLVFTLGLSADAIFFSVEGGLAPIPLPDFGRYPGSAIILDRFLIGYGYSKNSLKIDVAGELELSKQLIDDADTSATHGAGIRLPEDSKLKFKLDLIPIVLGEVDFLLPLVAFDIDLRSDRPLPAPLQDGRCRPVWDGLQVNVPGVLRAGFKRYAMSPFFGPLPAPNQRAAFDLELGDEELGLRHVSDDYQVITPVLGKLVIPFLADATPFMDRHCLSVRVAGFELSYDVVRPFPNPSPLLFFELLGFLSDPTVPIDPEGHIASLMYAELLHGRIAVPPAVLNFFPGAEAIIGQDLQARIDVTTVIALGQQLRSLVEQLQARIVDAGDSVVDWAESLAATPLEIDPVELLAHLPASVRTVHAEGRFLSFEASAWFFLALPGELTNAIDAPEPPGERSWRVVHRTDFDETALPDWKRYNHGLKRGTGSWRVRGGQLVQSNNVGDNSYARYGSMIVYEADAVADVRLEVSASSTDNDGLGVVFHFQGERTFYRFRMTEEQREWRLDKVVDGDITILHQSTSSFVQERPYEIRVEAVSRGGESAGLERRLSDDPRRTSRQPPAAIAIEDLVDAREAGQRAITQIRVWVDDALWCEVDDGDEPLTYGFAGLDSWWNTGARFDRFALYEGEHVDFPLARESDLDAQALATLRRTLTPADGGLPQVLAAYSADDLLAALTDAPEVAVMVAARVRVFASHQAEMVGWFASDGHFHLTSSLALELLALEVAGLTVPLPLDLRGRITLAGRSAGADSHVVLTAQGVADWQVLPREDGAGALARLTLGRKDEAVTLRMASDREFELTGPGALHLFDGQVQMDGRAQISHAQALIEGTLAMDALPQADGTPLFGLRAEAVGRLGPGPQLLLRGEGELLLLGRTLVASEITATERSIDLRAALGESGALRRWDFGGLVFSRMRLALAGQVSLPADEHAALTLTGEGGFRVHGITFDGACRIEAKAYEWLLAASGRVHWLGRNWIGGGLALSHEGVQVSGRADFGLQLTPTHLPAGIEILGLQLRVRVSGSLTLNTAGQLVAWRVDLDWQLAARLPGQSAKQAMALATQQFSAEGSHAGGEGLVELAELFSLNGLTLFDLGDYTLPIPVLDDSNGTPIYVHDSLTVDVDGDDGLSATFVTPFPPDEDAEPIDSGFLPIPFYEAESSIDLPALTLPVPTLSSEPPSGAAGDPLVEVPALSEGSVSLPKIELANTALTLRLAWRDGTLGVVVGETDVFRAFRADAALDAIFGQGLD
ncbi:MAG: hypothetical protein AAF184_02735, partial [Pseudomonadota bacterium]